jgi:hypothetical protein
MAHGSFDARARRSSPALWLDTHKRAALAVAGAVAVLGVALGITARA